MFLKCGCLCISLTPFSSSGLVYALLLNAAASIGDLWVAWRLVSHPRAALFADNPERGGICVYLPR
jgi:hypothetical protein